jgi:hypothetical protein
MSEFDPFNENSDPPIVDICVVVDQIVAQSEAMRRFWSSAHGWAPSEAAKLLAKSRLDRQVSLSRTLKIWLVPTTREDHDGRLILAWVNLGCLVESLMKIFLSVYRSDYGRAPLVDAQRQTLEVDGLSLDKLLQFFSRNVWVATQRDRWEGWAKRMQQRRNAIHFYKERNIGTFEEFLDDVRKYQVLLLEIDGQLPYP